MNSTGVIRHISQWLQNYANDAGIHGFVIGISGGIDSAVTSTLCALSGKNVLCLNMPIHQEASQCQRASDHIHWLQVKHLNVKSETIDLTSAFETLRQSIPEDARNHELSMANTRARLRMTTLYALGQAHGYLVAGTGNKVEDFGVGFFTKYGDGGVDLSPIADLYKTEVFKVAKELGIIQSIQEAPPTDGLWEDGRTDEDALGASYAELEWAMEYTGDKSGLTEQQAYVLETYERLHRVNQHKMKPIPVCTIPDSLR